MSHYSLPNGALEVVITSINKILKVCRSFSAFVCAPVSLSLSLCMPVRPSVCLSVSQSLCPSLCPPASLSVSLLTVLANTCITCLSITVVLLIIVATLASVLFSLSSLFHFFFSSPAHVALVRSSYTDLHSNGTYARRLYCLCANCLALMCDICNLISAHNTSASPSPLPHTRRVEPPFTSCCHWQRLRYGVSFLSSRPSFSVCRQSSRHRIMNGHQLSIILAVVQVAFPFAAFD